MKAESILSKIFLTLLSIVIIFACLEIAMRVYLRYFASEDSFRKYASLNQIAERYAKRELQQAYSPHRYLGYYPTPNYQSGLNKHNSLGFRGEEIQKDKQSVFEALPVTSPNASVQRRRKQRSKKNFVSLRRWRPLVVWLGGSPMTSITS